MHIGDMHCNTIMQLWLARLRGKKIHFCNAENGEDEDSSYFLRFQPRTDNGLKTKGFEAVEEMERLGILPDVSHLSDAGFYDLAKTIKGPFVASHSNARALAGCNRNLTDDMIKVVTNHGGVIGLNFCPAFLGEASDCDGGVTRLASGDLAVRVLGNRAQKLQEVAEKIKGLFRMYD